MNIFFSLGYANKNATETMSKTKVIAKHFPSMTVPHWPLESCCSSDYPNSEGLEYIVTYPSPQKYGIKLINRL